MRPKRRDPAIRLEHAISRVGWVICRSSLSPMPVAASRTVVGELARTR